MRCRNLFLAVLATLSVLLQGCNRPLRYVQGYYDRTLKESEISWVTIGRVYDGKNQPDSGYIQVMFEGLPQTIFGYGNLFRMVAFPSGDRTIQVKYHRGGGIGGASWTEWVEMKKSLKGGKCYEINATRKDPGMFSLAASRVSFRIEESSCSRLILQGWYARVELYGLGGYKAMPKLELLKSYDIDDDIFSQLSRKKRNGETDIIVPFEFIRKLYETLE